jgi:predicted nucleotide-binding protein
MGWELQGEYYVILLYHGNLEIPPDIHGVVYLKLQQHL